MSALTHLIAGLAAEDPCELPRALLARISAQSASEPSGRVRDWLLGLARANGWM